jgi:hypothetical protein
MPALPSVFHKATAHAASLNFNNGNNIFAHYLGKVRPPVVEMISANYTLFASSAKENPDSSFVMAIFI